MKIPMIEILVVTVLGITYPGNAQSFEETVNKEYKSFKVLYVANVNGNIEVESNDGIGIQMEVKKKLSAERGGDIEEIKKNVKLAQMVRGDSLIIYIQGIGDCFCAGYNKNNWRRNYHYQFDDWDYDFDFNFDFMIKVPANTDLYLSTINNGDVNVRNITGKLNAKNINGSITLDNISGATKARTINGDVLINYSSNPVDASKYYTLNGDIKANFKKSLNAVLTFESYNGNLFTNIEELTYLPVRVEKTEIKNKSGIKYKIGEKTEIRIRNGGVYLDFETFNGDVIVKEI